MADLWTADNLPELVDKYRPSPEMRGTLAELLNEYEAWKTAEFKKRVQRTTDAHRRALERLAEGG